jgi:hypothetical protein
MREKRESLARHAGADGLADARCARAYVLAPALLFTVVVAASSLPALRATRVPAIAALRGE